MESNWGKCINQSVSKTVNFRNNVTVEEVKEAIIYCWKNKIKGISFYRDGSRKNQVIQTTSSYNTSFLVSYRHGDIEQITENSVLILDKDNNIIKKAVSDLKKGDIILEEIF
jgi:ribonucleotide reductase alpha subunit